MADDFEALRTIRAAAGEPDAERAARMRARALASAFGDAAGTEEAGSGAVLTDVSAPPSPDARPTDLRRSHPGRPRRRDRADHLVHLVPGGPTEIHLDRPDHEADASSPGTGGSGHDGRRPFLVVAAAAAVIALVIGVAVARSGQRGEVVADQPRPDDVAQIAANAATLVDRPLAAGEYAYLAVESGQPFNDLDGTASTHVQDVESWVSSTGEGRRRTSATDIIDGSGRTVGTFDVASDTGPTTDVPGLSAFGYERMRALPTDATSLRAVLDSGEVAPASAYSRSYLLTDLLTLDSTPPAVRAAALTILAEDGATLLPDAVDRDGRAGIGIVLPRSDGFTSVYVVNRDGLLLGSYDVVTGDALDPDRAVVWSTVRDQRRVTSTD